MINIIIIINNIKGKEKKVYMSENRRIRNKNNKY